MARIDDRTLTYLLTSRFGPQPSRSQRMRIWTSRVLNRLGLSRLAAAPLDDCRSALSEGVLLSPIQPSSRRGRRRGH